MNLSFTDLPFPAQYSFTSEHPNTPTLTVNNKSDVLYGEAIYVNCSHNTYFFTIYTKYLRIIYKILYFPCVFKKSHYWQVVVVLKK